MGGNLEYIIKPSHEPAGYPLLEHALPCSCVMPIGIWGSRGARRLGGTALRPPGRPGRRMV